MIRAIAFALALFFAVGVAKADIAFVRASDLGNVIANNYTAAFTATGGNLLIVGIAGDATTAYGGGAHNDITSVTYAGATMTGASSYTTDGSEQRFTYLYYLLNPATGSNNIVVNTTNIHYIFLDAAVYSGAASVAPGSADATIDTGNNDAFASTTTTTQDRAWAIMYAFNEGNGTTPTCSAGATTRTTDAAFATFEICDSNGPVTPPQTYSMTSTIAGALARATHLLASFGPPVGGLMLKGCCQ